MSIVYAFPEPLPLPRARGLQAMNTVVALASMGLPIELAYVPGGGDPVSHYGLTCPAALRLHEISRSLSWPLGRIHSNRLFFRRMIARYDSKTHLFFVRHIKLAALLANSAAKPPFIYEAHEVFSDTAEGSRQQVRFREENIVMRNARAVIANSSATAKRLVALHGPTSRLEVVPNGVDWPQQIAEKDWGRCRQRIVYVGSLFPWKGVAELVQAAAMLPEDFSIDVVGGEGLRLDSLRAGAEQRGAKLTFHGHQSHETVGALLNEACIAILPNRADKDSEFTSPIKLFEYMAAGCAIVASDLPSIREILGNDEAVWCAPGDAGTLASGIKKLAEDPELAKRLGERVREKAKRYTWNERARRIQEIITASWPGHES